MIHRKAWNGVAPSTNADSSSDLGMVSKYPFMNQVLNPMAPPRYTSTSPGWVPSPSQGRCSLMASRMR